MHNNFIAFLLALACLPAAAAEVALLGTIGDKAAILSVDGGDPKTVRVDQKWNGILVLEVGKDRATVEIGGKKRVLVRGEHYKATAAVASDRQSVTLVADPSGHFVGEGAINGIMMRFVIDTGATTVALPAAEARRAGIDYQKGERGQARTAGGVVNTYRVVFERVKLGSIELSSIEGVVIEQGLDMVLLGMSFLNRVEMKRDGSMMVLTRRF